MPEETTYPVPTTVPYAPESSGTGPVGTTVRPIPRGLNMPGRGGQLQQQNLRFGGAPRRPSVWEAIAAAISGNSTSVPASAVPNVPTVPSASGMVRPSGGRRPTIAEVRQMKREALKARMRARRQARLDHTRQLYSATHSRPPTVTTVAPINPKNSKRGLSGLGDVSPAVTLGGMVLLGAALWIGVPVLIAVLKGE